MSVDDRPGKRYNLRPQLTEQNYHESEQNNKPAKIKVSSCFLLISL